MRWTDKNYLSLSAVHVDLKVFFDIVFDMAQRHVLTINAYPDNSSVDKIVFIQHICKEAAAMMEKPELQERLDDDSVWFGHVCKAVSPLFHPLLSF